MADSIPSLACSRCGGTELRYGTMPDAHLFKPQENWFTLHPIRAHVCLRCGTVGLQLDQSALEQLRSSST